MNFSFHKGDEVLYRYSLQENHSHERMTDCLQYLFLELPNCTKAMTPEATVLDNFCYALHNISRLPSRPEGLDGEIFDLLFKSADLTTFAKDERLQYFDDMHTKEDIERMIEYAREEGMEKGMEKTNLDHAKKMLASECSVDLIAQITGLSPEAIQALQQQK